MKTRLEALHDQWVEFAELAEARLLCWVVTPEEAAMVDSFIASESEGDAGSCPDVFLRFDQSFVHSELYSQILLEALDNISEAEHNGHPAPIGAASSRTAALVAAATALKNQLGEPCRYLVLVLAPHEVSDWQAYQLWLQSLLQECRDAPLRIVCFDDVDLLALESLKDAEPALVQRTVASLDMARAREDLTQNAGQQDTPEGQFLLLWARLTRTAEAGELQNLLALGRQASEVAETRGWYHLMLTVQLVMGNALLATREPREALPYFRAAEKAAVRAENNGEAGGAEIRLKTRLAVGSALLACEMFGPAASHYEESAALAHQLGESSLELECWRMASYCHEQQHAWTAAWEGGQRAWALGASLDEEARRTSPLGSVAEGLLRVTQQPEYQPQAHRLVKDIKRVLGPDWRPTPGTVPHLISDSSTAA